MVPFGSRNEIVLMYEAEIIIQTLFTYSILLLEGALNKWQARYRIFMSSMLKSIQPTNVANTVTVQH